MPLETTLVYDSAILRGAVLGFWRRTLGAGFWVAIALVVGFLVFLVAQGERSWVVGALGMVVVLAVGMAASLYVVHYRNALRKFQQMGSPSAHFTAELESFTVTSGAGTSTLRWSVVQAVWRFPGVWLLLLSKAQFITLPLQCLSPELQALILQRVQASGGKVAA